MHHAYFIEAGIDDGARSAREIIAAELGMDAKANPDVVILTFGLFSTEDARAVAAHANSAPLRGDKKVIVIAANRAYHESQNALLKIFEEPAPGTHLFFILPSAGQLLPTLRSRLQVRDLSEKKTEQVPALPQAASAFIEADREKRTTIAKKLATGGDEDERRENRDTALAIVNGIEQAVVQSGAAAKQFKLLEELADLRGHLHARSAPVRMILEHLAIVVPRNLVQ